MSKINVGDAFVGTAIEVNPTSRLVVYRPDLNAESPWHFENIHALDLAAGYSEFFNGDTEELMAKVEQGEVRLATEEEVELIRSYDRASVPETDGFKEGDIYVDSEELAVGYANAPRFGYYPSYRADRPWVLQNPEPIMVLFQGSGPFTYLHEGDIKERIDKGELVKVSPEDAEAYASENKDLDLLFT